MRYNRLVAGLILGLISQTMAAIARWEHGPLYRFRDPSEPTPAGGLGFGKSSDTYIQFIESHRSDQSLNQDVLDVGYESLSDRRLREVGDSSSSAGSSSSSSSNSRPGGSYHSDLSTSSKTSQLGDKNNSGWNFETVLELDKMYTVEMNRDVIDV
ncbi:hypothetical protein DFH28DRAFT_929733 [Melampsora americana]|nr:hypothetical protein DFH28DRAFT_929733 [Melampsora americana]